MLPIEEPPEPWRSFFAEVDSHLREDVQLHCCGGFVVTQVYGVAGATSDVDFLSVVPDVRAELTEIAGKGSALHQKHNVYLDAVTVAIPPENYEERLAPMFPGAWINSASLRWRPTTWLSPSWSGISNVIVTTCGTKFTAR
jgi:hypothetical protein